MSECRFCGQEIHWEPYMSTSGYQKYRAVSPNGTLHQPNCPRGNLFLRSKLRCWRGCDTPLQREAHEFLHGRLLGEDDYRVLYCPSCSWHYDWHVSVTGVGFGEVETQLGRLKESDRDLVGNKIIIVNPAHYQRFLASQPEEIPLPF